MMAFQGRFATTLLALALSGCTGLTPQTYQQQSPPLSLEAYFNGSLTAWGMFEDRSGEVIRRFKVDINGTWQDGVGTLEEDFSYADGQIERRVWTIQALPEGRYIGTAADVIGEAKGHAAGNALHWQYTLALPVGESIYQVQLDDWMYLIDERVMINRASMSKFGIHLGEITITFIKNGN